MTDPKIPRRVKSRMVKDRILETATKLIREHGYECVTVHNVCQAAEVSVGSFYHHFENKDQLLAYYLVAAFEERAQKFSEVSDDDVVHAVIQCYHLYDDFLLDQGFDFVKNYYTTQNKGLDTSKRNDSTVTVPIMDKTISLMAKAVEAGDMLPETDAAQLGEDLCRLEKGVVFDWCLCDAGYDLKAQTQHMMETYLRAFLTPQYWSKRSEQA